MGGEGAPKKRNRFRVSDDDEGNQLESQHTSDRQDDDAVSDRDCKRLKTSRAGTGEVADDTGGANEGLDDETLEKEAFKRMFEKFNSFCNELDSIFSTYHEPAKQCEGYLEHFLDHFQQHGELYKREWLSETRAGKLVAKFNKRYPNNSFMSRCCDLASDLTARWRGAFPKEREKGTHITAEGKAEDAAPALTPGPLKGTPPTAAPRNTTEATLQGACTTAERVEEEVSKVDQEVQVSPMPSPQRAPKQDHVASPEQEACRSTGDPVRDKAVSILQLALTPPHVFTPIKLADLLEKAIYIMYKEQDGTAGNRYKGQLHSVWKLVCPDSPRHVLGLQDLMLSGDVHMSDMLKLSDDTVQELMAKGRTVTSFDDDIPNGASPMDVEHPEPAAQEDPHALDHGAEPAANTPVPSAAEDSLPAVPAPLPAPTTEQQSTAVQENTTMPATAMDHINAVLPATSIAPPAPHTETQRETAPVLPVPSMAPPPPHTETDPSAPVLPATSIAPPAPGTETAPVLPVTSTASPLPHTEAAPGAPVLPVTSTAPPPPHTETAPGAPEDHNGRQSTADMQDRRKRPNRWDQLGPPLPHGGAPHRDESQLRDAGHDGPSEVRPYPMHEGGPGQGAPRYHDRRHDRDRHQSRGQDYDRGQDRNRHRSRDRDVPRGRDWDRHRSREGDGNQDWYRHRSREGDGNQDWYRHRSQEGDGNQDRYRHWSQEGDGDSNRDQDRHWRGSYRRSAEPSSQNPGWEQGNPRPLRDYSEQPSSLVAMAEHYGSEFGSWRENGGGDRQEWGQSAPPGWDDARYARGQMGDQGPLEGPPAADRRTPPYSRDTQNGEPTPPGVSH